MQSIAMIISYALTFVFYIVIIQAVMSWLVAFNVVNLHQRLVYQVWFGLNRLTEPLYRPIRRFLPDMGGIDISPLVVIFAIYAIQTILANNFGSAAYGY